MASDGKQATPHHHVAFAMTYFRGAFRTFNAASALYRVEQLIEEAEQLGAMLQLQPLDRFPTTLPQFPGYYLIGFVTCLEWHARSRLADLLAYAPDRTTSDDLKAVTESGKLREMVVSRLTVPELVGASTNVSKLRNYIAIFDRILQAIMPSDEVCHAAEVIKISDVREEASAWLNLESIYETRHRLVHEISYEQVGHYNLRNTISIDDAVRMGRLVKRCMREIERVITEHAPGDFPNLLGSDGYPVHELERLRADIEAVERELETYAIIRPDALLDPGLDLRAIVPAVAAARCHIEAESVWLREFLPAGWKYHDQSYELEVSLLRHRLAYAREVKEVRKTS